MTAMVGLMAPASRLEPGIGWWTEQRTKRTRMQQHTKRFALEPCLVQQAPQPIPGPASQIMEMNMRYMLRFFGSGR